MDENQTIQDTATKKIQAISIDQSPTTARIVSASENPCIPYI